MTGSSYSVFQKSGPHVVSEMIDGEVICLNLTTGNYYSLRDVAAAIWVLAERQTPVGAIAAELTEGYDDTPATVELTVRQFLGELHQEGLLEPVAEMDVAPAQPTPVVDATRSLDVTPASERGRYRAPTLEKYTHMQQFLLVDPIHEIDVTRWPAPEKK